MNKQTIQEFLENKFKGQYYDGVRDGIKLCTDILCQRDTEYKTSFSDTLMQYQRHIDDHILAMPISLILLKLLRFRNTNHTHLDSIIDLVNYCLLVDYFVANYDGVIPRYSKIVEKHFSDVRPLKEFLRDFFIALELNHTKSYMNSLNYKGVLELIQQVQKGQK